MRSRAVSLRAVSRVYRWRGDVVTALQDVTVAFERGSFTAVMGASGSGKSTLLRCAAGLDTPTSGQVVIGGTALEDMDSDALARMRRTRVGFVFQSFNLLPALTVAQNVELPPRLAGARVDRRRLREVLDWVGLSDRARHRPAELSGGQQQRAAIARALAPRPDVIFADEPTGALDRGTAREILELLRAAVDQAGQTVVMVTHDPVAAAYADRVLFLADGRLVTTMDHPDADRVAAVLTQMDAGRVRSE
jgi:putative ABC transport system ATP-binding protein